MVTKPTGKPRGRPRKRPLLRKQSCPRGRPIKTLANDPDRYAVAAIPAFRTVFQLNDRQASVLAVKLIGAMGVAETVRYKTRIVWLVAGMSHISAGNYLNEIRFGIDHGSIKLLKRRNKNLNWLLMTGAAIYIALSGQNREAQKNLEQIKQLIDLSTDIEFVRTRLVPLLVNDRQVLDFMREHFF